MSLFQKAINWGPFARVRRNHALEHATLQVLSETNPSLKMAGYSDPNGFWLLGNIEQHKVEEAAYQALQRLHNGEHNLAIHPHCGTNLVATGFMAGGLAWLGMLGVGRSARDRFERLPMIMSLVTIAVILSQPVGPYLQSRVTTNADAPGLEIVSVQRVQRGDAPMIRVLTRS